MARIIPFQGIRPTRDKVHLVASRSVDNYGKTDLHEKLRSNPFSFLHVINPDFKDGKRSRPGSPERLRKVKAQYEAFQNEGIFVQDEKPCYYVYRQYKQGNTYTGIIACTSIDDYLNGTIKIHEQTLTDRESKLKEYLEICDFNAEPVLFCYPDDAAIDAVIATKTNERAEYDFTTTDRVRHSFWVIDGKKDTTTIRQAFEAMPAVYIADGHHRSASSTLLGQSRREKNQNYSGNEPWNFYLGVFFPETQLRIYDFNRVVKDLNGLDAPQFLEKLRASFEIQDHGKTIFTPQHIHQFGLYLEGNWFELRLKKELIHDDEPVGSLDAFLLTKHVLDPILGIVDLKTDKRIGFVSGIKGPEELMNQVDHWKFQAAFSLFPVSMKQLKYIADTNSIMPPKTTWVEPKMRSGLVMFSIAD